MSEISKDLQDQLRAGQDPLLRRFLEKKPGYDGPTLSADDEEKLRREAQVHAKTGLIEAELKNKGKIA